MPLKFQYFLWRRPKSDFKTFPNKNTKNFLAHNILFYSAVSIVVLQAKQAGSVLRSIYKSFTITFTRSQHGQHNSRFLDYPWESTFSASTPPRQLFVFVLSLSNLQTGLNFFIKGREWLNKVIQIFLFFSNKVTVFLFFFTLWRGSHSPNFSLKKRKKTNPWFCWKKLCRFTTKI